MTIEAKKSTVRATVWTRPVLNRLGSLDSVKNHNTGPSQGPNNAS